ncbi:unnamed protein product [Urochloa decumbens]|uniref:DUF6598 domain-containing protein n=1 Tax=Urochloa decumbens TaxID=240449 RepID=A0ABC9F9H7_9POAL
MRFTFKKAPSDAMHENALQMFSVKVTATTGGLPFDVFGMFAMRDCIDHNRNIVFCRTRDNCQTLTEEHPYLVLTGPTRAVLLESPPPVFIEVDLTVKGTTDSEDEKLSSLVVPISSSSTMYSHMWKCAYTSKLSTIEFTLGHIVSAVEATIFVRVTHGSWPDVFAVNFLPLLLVYMAELPTQFIIPVLMMKNSSCSILEVRRCLLLVMAISSFHGVLFLLTPQDC